MSLLASITDYLTDPHKLIEMIRDPRGIVEAGGYWALGLIIFLETGALVALLPGDSLLVVAGIFAAGGSLNIVYLNLLLIPLAILGDALSYLIGAKVGSTLFTRPKSRIFNPAHIQKAHGFYERHGGKAIVMARFVPIMRTFVPVVAGFAGMRYRDFAMFNVMGAASWILSMTLIGYFLGSVFPGLDRQIDKIVIVVVLLSILPIVFEYLKARRASNPAHG
jgi:membrane-associated protein